ncbi:hypothetical protein RRG08_029330 [Elysia crispata]|uniref:Uncharacterized protein n=1 Tax=Elysia crispata TaxID=231223 RepID=A0AAE1E3L7_9GAST|nr:hypothetical protein RRG08_029330 [Elysia crispata]
MKYMQRKFQRESAIRKFGLIQPLRSSESSRYPSPQFSLVSAPVSSSVSPVASIEVLLVLYGDQFSLDSALV